MMRKKRHKRRLVTSILHFRCATPEVERRIIRLFKKMRIKFPPTTLVLLSYVWREGNKSFINEVEIKVIDL